MVLTAHQTQLWLAAAWWLESHGGHRARAAVEVLGVPEAAQRCAVHVFGAVPPFGTN